MSLVSEFGSDTERDSLRAPKGFSGMCLAVSIILHIALLAAFVNQSSRFMKNSAPLVIDLTLNNQSILEQLREEKIRPSTAPPRQSAAPKPTPPVLQQSQTAVQTPQQSYQQAMTAAPSPHAAAPVGDTPRSPPTLTAPIVSAGSQASQHIEVKISRETIQQHYLKEHFTYIRDLIGKRLSYPPVARRMGWSGKVVVAFTIAEDGSVQSIRVRESSGYQMLDSCALSTITTIAPFPRPPVAAEIVVPVHFRLH